MNANVKANVNTPANYLDQVHLFRIYAEDKKDQSLKICLFREHAELFLDLKTNIRMGSVGIYGYIMIYLFNTSKKLGFKLHQFVWIFRQSLC